VAYAFSDEMKIIDLGWPSRSDNQYDRPHPSDSWDSCFFCASTLTYIVLTY